MGDKVIRVSDVLFKYIWKKQRPRETFSETIERLLDEAYADYPGTEDAGHGRKAMEADGAPHSSTP